MKLLSGHTFSKGYVVFLVNLVDFVCDGNYASAGKELVKIEMKIYDFSNTFFFYLGCKLF